MMYPFNITFLSRICKKSRNSQFIPLRYMSHNQSSDLVYRSFQDHLHLIGINRPQKKNCVNHETALKLREAFQNFSADENAYVGVLYGVGGTFCAGYDLEEVASGKAPTLKLDDGPMGPTKLVLRKPVIAAIDGYAVAGGLELALWCDLRVMEEDAVLGVLCRRFGVPLIDGGTVRLPKLIGLSRALDLILTGRKVNANEAYEMGLVTMICKKGKALETAIELANKICDVPQDIILMNHKLMHKVAYDANLIKEIYKD